VNRLWILSGTAVCLAFAAIAGPSIIAAAKLNLDLIRCLQITQALPRGCSLKTAAASDRAEYHIGIDAYRSGHATEAVKHLSLYVATHPVDDAAGYFLGLAYRQAGDEAGARAAWRRTGAVRAFHARARQSGAIQDYETAIEAGDTDPDMFYEAGELLLEAGREPRAKIHYEEGLSLDTRRSDRRSLAEGRLTELRGDWQRAIAINEAVAERNAAMSEPYYRIAQIYQFRLKQLRPALEWYTLGATKANSLACYVGAGEVDRELGNFTEAEGWARRAQQASPESAAPLLLLASTLETEKRYGEADLAYDAAERREPRSFWPPYDRGEAELRRGDAKRAVKSLARASELNSSSPYIYLALGRAYSAIGQERQATAAFRRAHELGAPPNGR
jgi:tetratricopeptide (TPR) repeat protein